LIYFKLRFSSNATTEYGDNKILREAPRSNDKVVQQEAKESKDKKKKNKKE
jgi:hypothetical protein